MRALLPHCPGPKDVTGLFKSIFTKYFTVMSLIIVISFAAMGLMQMLFSTQYWVEEKRNLLEENTLTLAEMTAQHTVQDESNANQYNILGTRLSPYLSMMADAIDATVLVVDNDGEVVLCSDPVLAGESAVLSTAVLNKMDGSRFFEVGQLGGFYASRQYTAGAPIILEDVQVRLGYVFLSTSAAGLSEYLMNNLQVFFLSALGVLTLTFIALYIMTYRMVRPLRQMAAATRSFGMGDFSYRIPVRGKDEVAELAASLNNMAVSLSSVEGMRRSFVANVSHELKTPMTTIAGFIDGILDGTIPEEKREHYLKIVSDEVKRLSRLVKSMLDLSRIDNGELHLKPVRYDLTEQACTVLLSFEKRIEEKEITVQGLEDCPRVEVSADYDLLGQVIYNLVDNAVKFIDVGGTLSLHIEKREGRVYCAIRNTGGGIPAQEMPHIFERFYKSDRSRSLDKNGMGLGLYIVKTIINLHHGEIVVRSAEGGYTEFEFWLPDAEPRKRGTL